MTAIRAVIVTNVFAGALIGRDGHNRNVVRACLEERVRPVIGFALFLEYEDVLSRKQLFRKSPLSAGERGQLFQAFLSVCEWVQVYFLWRPNLPDEADNHLLELAVAGNVSAIVTNNVTDFRPSELRFPEIRIMAPTEPLEELG